MPSIDRLAALLREFPESGFTHTQDILEFLQRMPVDEVSLAPYLTWNAQHYTRNLIDKTPLYELLAICWEVGQASSIHNHLDQQCWMAAPIGRLLVQNYRVKSEDLKAGRCVIERSNQIEMNATHPTAVDPLAPVHKVYNPQEFGQRAVSLHVYSRPFDACVVYSEEQGTCGVIGLQYNSAYGKPTR
jgi:cysteine dioxygenase